MSRPDANDPPRLRFRALRVNRSATEAADKLVMDRRRLLLIAAMNLLPGAAWADGKPDKKQPRYLSLPSLTLTIVRPNRRHGAMTIDLGLDIPDPRLRELADESKPILRDAYVRALQPYAMRMTPGSPPSTDFLTMVLQRETDRVLGRKGAQVLLGGVLVI